MKFISALLLTLFTFSLLMNNWSCVNSGNNYQITLDSLNNALLHSADAYATIQSGSLSGIDEVGFCWNETGTPTINDNKQSGGPPAINNINSTIEGLSPDKTYFVRAFVRGEDFVKYSGEMSIKTWDGKATDGGGIVYQGTQVGNQGWLSENLRSTKYPDGSPVSTGNGSNRTYWYGSGHNYVPNFDTDINGDGTLNEQDSLLYVQEYGLLYSWFSANNYFDHFANPGMEGKKVRPGVRDICPTGFHIPTRLEWQELQNFLLSAHGSDISLYMTSKTGWLDGLNGNDFYGFSLKPNAYWQEPGATHSNILGRAAFLWLSTDINDTNGDYVQGDNFDKKFFSSSIGKAVHGLCVRCIKDK